MTQGTARKNKPVVKGVEATLGRFKYEVASELGIEVPQDNYWGSLTSRECGAVGGKMVKKLIQQAQQNL